MNANSSPRRDAVPLVLLPGLMCDSRMFTETLANLPHAAAIDGFYGGATSLEAMADYALARMPERCALLGHSMGGRVALEIFRKAPQRVDRLALVSTGVHALKDGERAGREALLELGRTQGMAALVEAWLRPMLADGGLGNVALFDRLGAMAVSAGLDTYGAQIEALLNRPEVDDLLPAIACPVLVAVGAEDRWSPPAQHQDIAAAILGATMRVVAAAGHMMPAEAPQAFNEIVVDWLAMPADRR
jgi:pimeloyl-ACP methyl ester carboxylesterase